jgi:hypothetical protein
MPWYSEEMRNAKLDANATIIGNAGLLRIYNGTKPSGGGAISTQTKLAEFTLGSPFAPAADNGVQDVTLPADVTGLASGTATWGRILKADGTTACIDVTVGTSAANVILNTTSITSGGDVSITDFTITDGNT